MRTAIGKNDAAAPADFKRGACPSIASPMLTGDGLLVRFRPKTLGLPLSSWKKIAALSDEFGNGIIEITARGNIQVRGLSSETAALFSAALQRSDIDVKTGISIETPPFADADPEAVANAGAFAADIAARIEKHLPALSLAPKLSIIVDGGGAANLAALTADIRLDAVSPSSWRIALAGDARSATPVAVYPAGQAVEAIIHILEELDRAGPGARGRDLDIAALGQKFDGTAQDIPNLPVSGEPDPTGTWCIGNKTVLGVKLRYGRTTAGELARLLTELEVLGVTEIRPAHGHTLMLCGLDPSTVEQARHLASISGFVTQETDPANALSVCTGAKGCASGTFDTRELADALLAAVPGLFDGSLHLHVSGCPKGCAHPAHTNLTLSGLPRTVGLIRDGRAGDTPLAEDEIHRIVPAFSRLDTLIRQVRKKGDTARSALDRIAIAQLAAVFQQGRK